MSDAPGSPAEVTSQPWTIGDRVGHVIAVWFGCGHVPLAPGTAGTLGAIPLYLALRPYGDIVVVLVAVALLFIGTWAAGTVVRRRGTHDPQIVVVDEVVGVLLTLAALPEEHTWRGVVAGFVLFRIFDQFKPFPARRAEKLPRGWGVMMDDVFAGLWGVAVIYLLRVLQVGQLL